MLLVRILYFLGIYSRSVQEGGHKLIVLTIALALLSEDLW